MQTRRKSLNLGDLGIVAAKRSRTTSTSHPSPPSTVPEIDEPHTKRAKLSPPSGRMSPPRTTVIRIKDEKPKSLAEMSPPPSPVAECANKIDTEGINDDIVIGTIQQLERTGNRPHLVKELAAVLATKLHIVEKSANPSALISSRLTAYLQRAWPAVSPCPLAKELSPVHPRRLYLYLTTGPHQPIPEVVEPVQKPTRIISPSLSSASAADEEDRFARDRHAMSPSPEVDLSSPEYDEDRGNSPPTPGGSFAQRGSVPRDASSYTARRAASPPLENEERDFKQTASALYEQALARRNSQESQKDVNMEQGDAVAGAEQRNDSVSISIEPDETEECAALKNREAAAALFESEHLQMPIDQTMDFSSPMLLAQNDTRGESAATTDHHDSNMDHMALDQSEKDTSMQLPDPAFAWDSLKSPENIEIAELEDMFDEY
ncbi:uncharacterized protein RCC_01830 [Ramularia collo-cygni]|uniref:GDS1 winged helix domain-containing protein n=1 Tax=Ramularia collo-cygni TaxID=112498 RepID=A0A2D3UT84_9PEZI|nr:uncharacterized protein RCC_01830 [Ramularia collo-cygni]CZT15990.1 uncharacterized protein RCC_01830 [Ramularia collo-cygni]